MEDFVENTADLFLKSGGSSPKKQKPHISETTFNENDDVIFCSLSQSQLEKNCSLKLPAFVQGSFSEFGCKFVLCSDSRILEGRLSKEELQTNAKDLNQTVQEYLINAQSAFENVSDSLFLNICDDARGLVNILWQKRLENEAAFRFGCVAMHVAPTSEALTLKNGVFELTANLYETLQKTKSENNRILKQNARLQQELEQCSLAKTELEYCLLNKFVEILNEKKSKIKTLEVSLQYAIRYQFIQRARTYRPDWKVGPLRQEK